VLAESLGMAVWFYDTDDKLALGNAKRCGSIEELLEAVDIVNPLHVDGRATTGGFSARRSSPGWAQGSLFLNLSRGFVVDHGALRAHIESGTSPGGSGRVPERAQSQGRAVRLRAAGPAQRPS